MKKFREIYFPDNLISRGEFAKESRSNSHNQLKLEGNFYSSVMSELPKSGAAQSAKMAPKGGVAKLQLKQRNE